MARRMQAEGAVIGGEGNGGVIHPRLQHTRDAPAAAALILQHLLDEDNALSAAVSRWPSYVIVKEKVSFPEARSPTPTARSRKGSPRRRPTPATGSAWRGRANARGCTCGLRGPSPWFGSSAEAPEAAAVHALVRAAAERLQGSREGSSETSTRARRTRCAGSRK